MIVMELSLLNEEEKRHNSSEMNILFLAFCNMAYTAGNELNIFALDRWTQVIINILKQDWFRPVLKTVNSSFISVGYVKTFGGNYKSILPIVVHFHRFLGGCTPQSRSEPFFAVCKPFFSFF